MSLGNYTPFRAKHVSGIFFSGTAFSDGTMAATTAALGNAFATINGANFLINLTGTSDTSNPTKEYAFAKDFNTSGNERASSEEYLLGADTQGSQNSEISVGGSSQISAEFTCVYRNPVVTSLFSDNTKLCLITLNNAESSTTGKVNLVFNNVIMNHVGSLTRNADGLMEQKVKFSIRGGMSGSAITVVDNGETWVKYRVGLDYAEEIRTA